MLMLCRIRGVASHCPQHHLYVCCRLVHVAGGKEPLDLRSCTQQDLEEACQDHAPHTAATLSVLGTGGNELSPSLLLECPDRTYLFNHGEGWKRMLESLKLRLSERRVSLFTRACWEHVGGSPSVLYSQTGVLERQSYCGPQAIRYFMEYVKTFTGMSSWEDVKRCRDPGQPGVLEDKSVSICVVELLKSADILSAPSSVVAYSCKLADWGGELVVEKAKELGVRKGPAYKVLLSGRSVVTEEGKVVHTSQVMSGARPGPTFLVVDCPTEEVMGALTTHPQLQGDWYSWRGERVELIVHITPLHLLQEQAYCEWLAGFGSDTKHLLLHASLCPGEVGYRSAMSFSLPFHLMNPSVYRLPQLPHKNQLHKHNLNICKHVKEDSVLIGRTQIKYHLKPSPRVDYSSCLSPIEEQLTRDLSSIKQNEKLVKTILHHRKRLSIPDLPSEKAILSSLSDHTLTLSDPHNLRVTFLGTSSSHSTKLRGVSGILLQTLTDGHVLLDCGEGTLTQLYRCFGWGPAQEILHNLKAIFVSHLHVDHHFGVLGVLSEVQRLTAGGGGEGRIGGETEPVKVICHNKYSKLLDKYCRWCENVRFEKVDAEAASSLPFPVSEHVTLQTVPVNHVKNSFGAVVRRGGEWSVVYSGDTMPCEALVEAGRDATLLIHEATVGDDLYEEARRQKHSTYREALMVSRAMNPKFTIMTHFSRRFVKYPMTVFDWPRRTAAAVDFMSFKLSDLTKQGLDSDSCRKVLRQIGLSSILKDTLDEN